MAYFNTDFLQNELKKIRDSKTTYPDINNVITQELVSNLMEVSSIECFFGKFSNEIDEYFTSFPIRNQNKEIDIILAELSTSSIANYFLYRKNASMDTELVWQWLDKLMYCIKRHIQSAGEYHQFNEKLYLCKDGIKSIHWCLKSVYKKIPKISITNLNNDLKECLLIMLNIIDVAEDLFKIHLTIIPVHHRVCNDQRMNAKLLIDCSISNIDLVENDSVVVIDKNFETNLWTVEKIVTEKDEEKTVMLKIPSLFLILDSYDHDIIKKCSLLKSRLMGAWRSIISHFETFIIVTTNEAIESTELSKNSKISQTVCHATLDRLINSLDLESKAAVSIGQIMLLRQHLEDDSVPGNDESIPDNWHILNETVQLFSDTKLYCQHFQTSLHPSNHREECYIAVNNPRYVTMAYISNISDELASEMELRTDNTITTISEDTLNAFDNMSNNSLTTPIPDDKIENGKSCSSSPVSNSYRSTFKFYLHESTITPKIPRKNILKLNPFVVLPSPSMPITEEENKNGTLEERTFEEIQLQNFRIIGIVNTENGETINTAKTQDGKLVDFKSRTFHDTKNDTWIPLKMAILQGLVLTIPKYSECDVERVYVDHVKIGKDQRKVPLIEAISENCIDPLNNTYHIAEENVEMKLVEAVMCGMIEIIDTPEQHKMLHDRFLVLHTTKNDPAIKAMCQYEMMAPINVKIISKAQESNCWNEFVNINERKESMAESIYHDHLNLDPLRCGDDNKKSLLAVCVKGSIDFVKVVDLLKNMKELFVGEIIDDLDTISSGKDIHHTLETMTSVDKKDIFVIDCYNMNIMSVDKIDTSMDEESFMTRINVVDIENKLQRLKKLEEMGVDTSKNVIAARAHNKHGVFDTSMMEAVIIDIMLLDTLEIRDGSNDELCGLEKSVDKYLIDEETAEDLLNYAEMLSFDELINDGIFNVENNSFGGEEGSLERAIEEEIVEPTLVYLMVPKTNAIMNLSNLINTGVLDAHTNEVTMENGEKEIVRMKLSEAINSECGLLLSKIDVTDMKKRLPKTLKIVTKESELNFNNDLIVFDAISIDTMPICAALEFGLVCEDSRVKLSKSEARDAKLITYLDNLELVELIHEVNQMLDELTSLDHESIVDVDSVANCNAELKSERIEQLELLLFDVLEKEKFLEDQIEAFTDSVKAATIKVNPIQLSFLVAQMENVKNISSKISHDIQGSQNALTKGDMLSSVTLELDKINHLRLQLNNIDQELNKLHKLKSSSLAKNILLDDLKDKIRRLKEFEEEIFLLSPKFLELKESIIGLFDRSRACQDENLTKKLSDTERSLMSLKGLRDSVTSNLESLVPYFGNILDNYNMLDQSLSHVEQLINEVDAKVQEESKHIPLVIQQLDNKFETFCQLKRDLSAIQQIFDKLEKNVTGDFKSSKLFVNLERKLVCCSEALGKLKNDINIQQKELSQTKNRINEMKQISNCLTAVANKIDKNLGDIKVKEKTESTFQDTIDIRKQFLDSMDQFEQLQNSCDSYINNPVYDHKEKMMSLRQNVIENQRLLYGKINEELIFQVESLISLILVEVEKLQTFLFDLPKSWNIVTEDIQMKVSEIKTYIEYLKEVETKLQNMDKVLSEDLIEQLDIDYENLENIIVNIQYCEKERATTQLDLEKILDIVLNSYLPTILSYDNSKHLADISLTEISKTISTTSRDIDSCVEECPSTTVANIADVLKDRRIDLQKLNEQLIEIEPMVDSVESYGFDIMEQLINLTTDYDSGCHPLPDIKEEVQQIAQRFRVAKNAIADMEIKINDLITPTIKSLNEQVNEELESWRLINDVVNQLDPVQSRPEKIKDQDHKIEQILDQIKKKESQFLVFKQTMNTIIADAHMEDTISAENPIEDIYDTGNDSNPSTTETEEVLNSLKDAENLIESIFYKVENRAAIIKDLVALSNSFWPEITSLNNTISEIQKSGSVTEVFPYTSGIITDHRARRISVGSESPSIATLCDNRSSTPSVDMENEERFDEEDESFFDKINEINVDIIKPELVSQQKDLLKKMDATVEECIEKLHSELEPKATQIIKAGGQSCAFEVNDYLETVWENVGTTQDILGEKHIEMDKGLYSVNVLVDELKKMAEWFPSMESRLSSIKDVEPDQKIIELNINQLKTLNAEVFSQFSKMEKLNCVMKEILSYPHVPNKAILEEMKSNIDGRYSALMKAIMDKHTELQTKYTDIGELDFVLDDNIGIMQELENQIKNFSRQRCKGDPEFTSGCLKNLKLLSRAFEKQQLVINNLNNSIASYKDSGVDIGLITRGGLTIFGKLKEINDLTRHIKELIPDKEKLLEEILRNEKLLSKDIHRFIDYLDTVKGFLKHSPKVGLTKESVHEFSVNYMDCMKELNDKKDSITASIEQANALITKCPFERCSSLATAVKTLMHKHRRCQDLALKRKEKLDLYSQIIIGFDNDKVALFKSILELEAMSLGKAKPSKLTRPCAEQIKHIKVTIQKSDKCLDVLEGLNIKSFEIKCFGNRFDNSQLHLEFKDYGLKIAKIQKCLRERLRIFQQAYKEDKLFSDSYENLITWLDDSYILVESFKHEPSKVQDHLDKLKHLCKQLSAQYANFHCTVRYGSYLKDRCLENDPEKDILLEMLKTLKIKWTKIRNLIIAEKTSINRKMIETGNLYDAIKCISYWINDIISRFDSKMKLCGDLDSVEVLIIDCQASVEEADNHSKDLAKLKERMLKEIKDYDENDIRNKITDVETQFMEYLSNLNGRKENLKESLELAKSFNMKLDDVRLWTNKAEKLLKLKSLPKFENETELIDLIEKHELFLKRLNEMKIVTNDMNNIGKTILSNCHPAAKTYVSRIIFTMGNRCNQIYQRADARTKKLNEALGTLRGSTALIEELIQKVADYLNKIRAASNSKLPIDIESANNLNNEHMTFHNGVIEMDLQIKFLIKEFKLRHPSCSNLQEKVLRYRDRAEFYQNIWRNSKDNINRGSEELTSNGRLNLLNSQFNVLWKLSVERKSVLQNKVLHLNEQELLKKFDFNTWRVEFITFVKTKGLRLTDLFRKQSVKRTGYLTEDEFIACITKSGFPSNKAVLKEVFHIFNRNNDNMISYQEFIDAMRPERRSIDIKYKNVNLDDKKAVMMIIHDIIEREVAACSCRQRFLVKKEGENKYRFGNNNKMYMVRYLNSSVMVRIGGGWQNLTEFLKIHDPCRGEKISVQMSAGDQHKLKKLKSAPSTETKTGTGTLTLMQMKSKSMIDEKSNIIVSPKPSRTSIAANTGELHDRTKKEQSTASSKIQPPRLSKPPTKK